MLGEYSASCELPMLMAPASFCFHFPSPLAQRSNLLTPLPLPCKTSPPATSFLLSQRQAVRTAYVLPPKTVMVSSQTGAIRWDLPQLPVTSPGRLPTSAVSFSLPLSNRFLFVTCSHFLSASPPAVPSPASWMPAPALLTENFKAS